jgi:hypothetical protein
MLQPEPPAKTAMRGIHRCAIHQWTTTDDGLYSVFGTGLQSLPGDAARAERAMEPDLRDATRRGLAHHFFGCLRRCDDDHAVDRSRNRGKVGVTNRTFEFTGAGIDRYDLEARGAQFAKHGVRRLATRTRDASNGKALSAQETRDFGRNVHTRSRRGTPKPQTVSGVERLAQAVWRRNDSEDALVQLVDAGLLRNAGEGITM